MHEVLKLSACLLFIYSCCLTLAYAVFERGTWFDGERVAGEMWQLVPQRYVQIGGPLCITGGWRAVDEVNC
ncbi:hypothetical protein RZS08_64970, partial [Arthrospira platensis SPKY1]|nr:hypothetical protein [Arthrospira platensis SPKY1]